MARFVQWFLSFYLIFLVESQEGHKGSMLLLDEPGLSLHPIAQRDLSDFFENLATTNQIAYTTQSPIMVDPDHLDRVKAVYVDEAGQQPFRLIYGLERRLRLNCTSVRSRTS